MYRLLLRRVAQPPLSRTIHAPRPSAPHSNIPQRDLELGRTPDQPDPDSLTRTISREDPASVVRTGRGGAGNWSTPEDQARTEFETSVKAAGKAAGKAAEPVAPPHRGRGGAGNFTGHTDAAAEEKIKAEQLEREGEMRRAVEEDVEKALARPGRARVVEKGELER